MVGCLSGYGPSALPAIPCTGPCRVQGRQQLPQGAVFGTYTTVPLAMLPSTLAQSTSVGQGLHTHVGLNTQLGETSHPHTHPSLSVKSPRLSPMSSPGIGSPPSPGGRIAVAGLISVFSGGVWMVATTCPCAYAVVDPSCHGLTCASPLSRLPVVSALPALDPSHNCGQADHTWRSNHSPPPSPHPGTGAASQSVRWARRRPWPLQVCPGH